MSRVYYAGINVINDSKSVGGNVFFYAGVMYGWPAKVLQAK